MFLIVVVYITGAKLNTLAPGFLMSTLESKLLIRL